MVLAGLACLVAKFITTPRSEPALDIQLLCFCSGGQGFLIYLACFQFFVCSLFDKGRALPTVMDVHWSSWSVLKSLIGTLKEWPLPVCFSIYIMMSYFSLGGIWRWVPNSNEERRHLHLRWRVTQESESSFFHSLWYAVWRHVLWSRHNPRGEKETKSAELPV